jgi:ribosomal protein L11 methyltransferase
VQSSTFKLCAQVPRIVRLQERSLKRDDFFAWVWQEFSSRGLLGVHEGTLLSQEAADSGFETDSWTVDAAEAPRERDWIAAQERSSAEFYFKDLESAQSAWKILEASAPNLKITEIKEQAHQDWDAEWKASFKGADVPPFWRVLPPWSTELPRRPDEVILKVNPGAGFGTGTHETTQLCLEAIGELGLKQSLQGTRVLDFGSGSGILAIGAALLGATVDGVEIDPLAIENALENAQINQMQGRVTFSQHLDTSGRRYPLIIANILKPVLLQFSTDLVNRLNENGRLVLSGLIAADVIEVSTTYSQLLGGRKPTVRSLGEWRALLWS